MFGPYLITAFLDDLLIVTNSYSQAKLLTMAVLQLFNLLSLMYHEKKCQLEPKTALDHLGFKLVINK